MAIKTIWLQNETYPARLDRNVIASMFRNSQRVLEGFETTERAAGANFTVEVSAGACVTMGDDQPYQGAYYVFSDSTETVTMPAAPGSDDRIDVIVVQTRDPNALGVAGDDSVLAVVQGVASATPAVPSLPASSTPIARVLRSSGESAVIDAAITDVRPLGPFPYGVGTSAPPSVGVDGDMYVQVAT